MTNVMTSGCSFANDDSSIESVAVNLLIRLPSTAASSDRVLRSFVVSFRQFTKSAMFYDAPPTENI